MPWFGFFGLLSPVCNPVCLVVILMDCNIFRTTFSRPFLLIISVYLNHCSSVHVSCVPMLVLGPCVFPHFSPWLLVCLVSSFSLWFFLGLSFACLLLFGFWTLDISLSLKLPASMSAFGSFPFSKPLKLGTKSQYVLLVHFLSPPFLNI